MVPNIVLIEDRVASRVVPFFFRCPVPYKQHLACNTPTVVGDVPRRSPEEVGTNSKVLLTLALIRVHILEVVAWSGHTLLRPLDLKLEASNG